MRTRDQQHLDSCGDWGGRSKGRRDRGGTGRERGGGLGSSEMRRCSSCEHGMLKGQRLGQARQQPACGVGGSGSSVWCLPRTWRSASLGIPRSVFCSAGPLLPSAYPVYSGHLMIGGFA